MTSAALKRLQVHGCTMENILKTSDNALGEIICPVGFWRVSIRLGQVHKTFFYYWVCRLKLKFHNLFKNKDFLVLNAFKIKFLG